MDEIICPECGRPNLAEAEKCWYCQVVLIKDSSESMPSENLQDFEILDSTASSQPEEQPEENVPDWLKRVRELRKADQPEEEESSQWQQDKLFKGQAEIKPLNENISDMPRHPARQPILDKEPKPDTLLDQPELAPISDISDQGIMEEPKDEFFEDESDQPQGDLPEGFLPLNN